MWTPICRHFHSSVARPLSVKSLLKLRSESYYLTSQHVRHAVRAPRRSPTVSQKVGPGMYSGSRYPLVGQDAGQVRFNSANTELKVT